MSVSVHNLQDDSLSKDDLARADVIIAIGGDGTLNSVISFLQKHKLEKPVLIIPRGSGNLMSKSLGIPRSIPRAIDLLWYGRARPIDLALLDNERIVVGAFALGYLSGRVSSTERALKAHLGFGGYLVSFMRMMRLPRHEFRITVDGNRVSEFGHSLFIVNASNVLGFHSRRKVVFEDGVFELVIPTRTSFFSLFGLVVDFYMRTRAPKHFYFARGKRFTIETDSSVSTLIDGETITHQKSVTLAVLPKQQLMIAP